MNKVIPVVFAGILLLPVISHATGYDCTGTVSQVTSDPGGNVVASFVFQSPSGSMPWETMCSITQVVNGIQIDACKSMFAVLLSAKLTQSDVVLWFNNETPGNCTMPAWSNLKDFGWYWGPALN